MPSPIYLAVPPASAHTDPSYVIFKVDENALFEEH